MNETSVAERIPARTPPRPPFTEDVERVYNAALERQSAGDVEGAIELYGRALRLYPYLIDGYNNLAVLLKQAKRIPAAIACLRRAVAYAPQLPMLYSNLGNMLWMNLEFEAAEVAFKRALELDANMPQAYHNFGLLHFSLTNYRAAIDCFDRSLELQPNNRLVLWDRALALLASGDFARGFAAYDTRFDLDDPTMGFDLNLRMVRSVPLPLWQGENIAGRTLYVYSEQGLGDTLQFARFIPLAARRGARVIFDCQPELLRLLSNLPGIAELRPQNSPLPAADFHLPLMSLPARLGITLETLPASVPYLMAPLAVVGPEVARPPGTRLAVGIAWAGRPQHTNDRNRSMALEHFFELCEIPGIALYSLQKGPRAEDIGKLGAQALVQDLGPQIYDFSDTARLLGRLDLVISVDSALAHLAGALGRPALVLLPFSPDWRWLSPRTDSPWYPTLRLFRQSTPGDWKGVMREIAALLAQRSV